MINEATKARAVAKLRQSVPPPDIADELDVPLKIVEKWGEELDPSDMVAVEANIHAVEKVLNGELMPDDQLEQKLKKVLEETAIDIAKNMAVPIVNGDMAHAKAVELCSKAVSDLYKTIVLKGGTGPGEGNGDTPSSETLKIFQSLKKD